MKKLTQKLTILLIITTLQFTLPISGLLTNILEANTTVVIPVSTNVFTNGTTSGDWRRFLAIGNFYDAADPTRTYYTNSEAYLKFDLGSIPAGAIIENAYVTVYKYANGGAGFTAELKPLLQAFDANTGRNINDYKAKGNVHSVAYIDNGNLDFDRINFNAKGLVQNWVNGQPNYGFVIDTNAPAYRSGAAVCSNRSDQYGFCAPQYFPTLTVEYNVNQPPYTPNPIAPANLSEISGGCDESVVPATGNCRTTTAQTLSIDGVGDGDPAPGNYRSTLFNFSRTTTSGVTTYNSPNITTAGRIDYTRQYEDGLHRWRARSVDNLGAIGNYSASWRFTTDTTPPTVPNIIDLPEYSSAIRDNTQILVNVSESIDNVQTGNNINYLLEYSTDADFTTSYVKPWQQARGFEIGPFGADQIEGTADDIVDGATYYFRSKSRDKVINNLWNTSAWSTTQSTIIDSTKPVVNDFSYSVESNNEYGRFSPNNETSVGQYDTVNFQFTWTELNPSVARIEIFQNSNLVKTITSESLDPTINLVWDGTNNNGQALLDGPYTARAIVEDLAGNTNDITQEHIIILDNSDANISISNPIPGFWTNLDTIDLSGQILNPNMGGEEDQDLSSAEYSVNNGAWNEIAYDENYIFEVTNINLQNLINTINFRTEDTVANTQSQFYSNQTNEYLDTLIINKDQILPQVEIEMEDGSTVSTQNTINFTVSDLESGFNFENPNIDLSLEIKLRLNPNTEFYSFFENILFVDGVNVNSTLVENVICTPSSQFTANNQNATNSADCTITFASGLPLDTDYILNITARDIATNESSDSVNFIKDSTVYLNIVSPNGSISTPNNYIDVELEVSENAKLNISNSLLGLSSELTVNQSLGSYSDDLITIDSIECGQTVDADSNYQNEEEAICTIRATVLQSASIDGLVENTTIFNIADEIGNTDQKSLDVNVDITDFAVEISSNLQYFSPNGDGNQDFVILSHNIGTDSDVQVDLDSYRIIVENELGNVVREFTGDSLGGENIWTAQIGQETVPDGLYRYYMTALTNAGVETTTAKKELFIFTNLEDELYITTPVDGGVSSDGVIEIEGQAPINTPTFGYESYLRGLVQIQICIDNISTPQDCDDLITTNVDTNGFFSAISILPISIDQQQSYFRISAIATDAFGNETDQSNIVNLIYDIQDPFNFISITPTLVGTNTEEDYQRFLNGEISLDDLKSVRLEAGVSENTSKVDFDFVESANVEEYHIGSVEGPCTQVAGCVWSTNYPIKFGMGGVYEVEFTGYKDSIVQKASTGFRVDGTIPSEAAIISVEKNVDDTWYILSKESDGQFYSNSNKVKFKGVADPNTRVNLMDNGIQIGTVVSGANGIWVLEVNLNTNGDLQTLNLRVDTIDGVNSTEGSLITILNYDERTPELTKVQRIVPEDNRQGWVQTGHSVLYRIESTEKLKFGDLIKEDGYIAQFSEESTNTYIVTINADRQLEGYYNPSIRLIDLAGNINQYNSETWEDYDLGDFRLYIDNTDPDATDFDRSLWSTTREEGGINADGLNPEIGRTSPGYVIRSNTIILYGYAEKNQRVEILVNSERWELTPVYDYSCLETEEEDILAPDGLVVKYAEKCKWNYTLKFVGQGLNNQFGVPNEYYTIQTRVYDSAANKSKISDPILIYYDTQAPRKVSVVGVQ